MSSKTIKTLSMRDAEKDGFINIDDVLRKQPEITTQTYDNITERTLKLCCVTENLRLREIVSCLIPHLHDFARECNLQEHEWVLAGEMLTECGKISVDRRHEFLLLSDIFGLSAVVQNQSDPKPEGCTISTVEGPFHVEPAQITEDGVINPQGAVGDPLLITGQVCDLRGKPIPNASIDIWETDGDGYYDVQYKKGQNCRGIVYTDNDGRYTIHALKPMPYPIPTDGPVGRTLLALGRHPFRPAHIHFVIKAEGYDELITTLFLKGDQFITSDAVMAVKQELIIDIVPKGDGTYTLEQNFVIPTVAESAAAKKEFAQKHKLGKSATNGVAH